MKKQDSSLHKGRGKYKKTMRRTSAVFLPALAMNIDLILFGFVTMAFLTFLLSLLHALLFFPVGRKFVLKHTPAKIKMENQKPSHLPSVYETVTRKMLKTQNTKLWDFMQGTEERIFKMNWIQGNLTKCYYRNWWNASQISGWVKWDCLIAAVNVNKKLFKRWVGFFSPIEIKRSSSSGPRGLGLRSSWDHFSVILTLTGKLNYEKPRSPVMIL